MGAGGGTVTRPYPCIPETHPSNRKDGIKRRESSSAGEIRLRASLMTAARSGAPVTFAQREGLGKEGIGTYRIALPERDS